MSTSGQEVGVEALHMSGRQLADLYPLLKIVFELCSADRLYHPRVSGYPSDASQ
jgi:hypothetical protein